MPITIRDVVSKWVTQANRELAGTGVIKMKNLPGRILIVTALCSLSLVFPQAAAGHRMPFPPPTAVHDSVRGRIVVRNGLLRNVYRERWGNGIQPGGAMVLTNLFNNLALVGTGYLTGTPQSSGSGKSTDAGDFASESAEVSDATHQQRMDTLKKIDERADSLLKALKVAIPTATDSFSSGDAASDGAFSSESGTKR